LGQSLCKISQMDWDDLRYVLALKRLNTLSAVAQSFGESHSTVGRRLRAIERKLGARLFDQTPEGFVATPAGQDYAEAAERVEAEVLALQARVAGQDKRLQGKLRVTTMDLLYSHYQAAFTSFIERYAGIELTVVVTNNASSLTRREADVALRLTNAPPQDLVGRRIGQLDFAPYASRALVARYGADPTQPDYPWLHLDERSNPKWLDEWLAANAPNARIAMRIEANAVMLREAIASGVGVSFASTAEADADPRLQRVGPVLTAFSQGCWLLTLPDLRSTRRVLAFMDHFATWLPQEAARPPG
jgi:DNA-binding transcriptional LysR family regulator